MTHVLTQHAGPPHCPRCVTCAARARCCSAAAGAAPTPPVTAAPSLQACACESPVVEAGWSDAHAPCNNWNAISMWIHDNRRFFKVGGPMTNLLENVRKRRTKILVMLAANQMNEQPHENTFVLQDQDLVHWSSYLKKRLLWSRLVGLVGYFWTRIRRAPSQQ